MSVKSDRLDLIKMIISSREISNQEELIQALKKENVSVTQSTLSRDLRKMNISKAISSSGKSVYVLSTNAMYKRVREHLPISEMMHNPGFVSLRFSHNLGIIKTRPGYASSIAYDIDRNDIPQILGTIAGDDTILFVIEEGVSYTEVKRALSNILPI